MGKLNSDQEALIAEARKELAEMVRNLRLLDNPEVRRAQRVIQLLDEAVKDV